MSLASFQGMAQRKGAKLAYYLQLSLLLCGFSGCNPGFLLSETSASYQKQTQTLDHNLQLGLAYLTAGDTMQAKVKLFEAEQRRPHDPYIKSVIAYLLEYIGEWQQAEWYHLKALELSRKKEGALYNNYGRFLCQCKRYQEAEKHFRQAVQDPNYANTDSAYENAGLCAMRIPDHSKAIGYLKIALKYNPRLEKSWFALAQLHQQQPLLAYQYFQRYQSLAPQETPASLALGIQLTQLNNKKVARHYALTLKEKYPNSREYKNSLSAYPELFKNK